MFALLYGYYFDPETKSYAKRTSIKKNGTDSDINLGLFTNSSLKEVSAIIFCNTLTLGKLSSIYKSSHVNFDTVLNVRYIVEEPHYRVQEVSPDNPEQLFDGLYLFHNPNAVNKLDPDLFNGVAQFSLDERGPHQIGNYPLIVSRYHTNMLPSNLLPTLKSEVFYNFNPEYCNKMINKESNEKIENNNSEKNRKKKRKMVKMARRKNR
ncbi:hypothetical protein QWJ20_21800 [Pectobacterium sp. S5]|uniref:hypothetical protein n=1 Tax=Pectobacterium TaxID=122277 RepID=UPI003D9BD3FC